MGNCCQNTESLPLRPSIQIPDELESKLINIRSFNLITVIGKGSFGKVLLMEKKDTKKLYAIKTIQKQKLYNVKKKTHAMIERQVLAKVTSPFVVKLHYSFQNSEKLYLVLDFMQGGDLYYHLRQRKCFSEEVSRFFAVEILLALEDLHANNILYRDLKPENILMDTQGHIKLADFNLAKSVRDGERTSTICGTPEYICPEILKGSPHGKEVDFWGLGVIIYEMIEGKSPFYASNYNQLFSRIVNGKFNFTEKFSPKAIDLISQLLVVSAKSRLKSIESVKKHQFFEGINWEEAYLKMLDPPIKPVVKNESDYRYFNLPPSSDTSPTVHWIPGQKENNAFSGFTYENSLKNEIN